MKPIFEPGRNIAMKVPPHQFEGTVRFYRDVLPLKQVDFSSSDPYESPGFEFGDKVLWIDKIESMSQAEMWLEIETDDIVEAAKYLEEQKVVRREDIERLPDGFAGFWITSPADIIHLVSESK